MKTTKKNVVRVLVVEMGGRGEAVVSKPLASGGPSRLSVRRVSGMERALEQLPRQDADLVVMDRPAREGQDYWDFLKVQAAAPQASILTLPEGPRRPAVNRVKGGVRTRLLSDISHEFLNNLASNQCAIPLLEEAAGASSDPRALEAYGLLKSNAFSLLTQAIGLLCLGRLGEGQALRLAKVDVRSPLFECSSRLRVLCGSKGIHLRFDYPATPLYGWVDKDSLIFCMLHLLINSIRNLPGSGEITISARQSPEPSGPILVTCLISGPGLTPVLQRAIAQGRLPLDCRAPSAAISALEMRLVRGILAGHGLRLRAGLGEESVRLSFALPVWTRAVARAGAEAGRGIEKAQGGPDEHADPHPRRIRAGSTS